MYNPFCNTQTTTILNIFHVIEFKENFLGHPKNSQKYIKFQVGRFRLYKVSELVTDAFHMYIRIHVLKIFFLFIFLLIVVILSLVSRIKLI